MSWGSGKKSFDRLRQQVLGEVGGRGDPQQPDGLLARVGQRAFAFGNGEERFDAMIVEDLAGLGSHSAAEWFAGSASCEPRLQPRDPRADGSRRHVEPRRGPREAACIHHFHEDLDRIGTHRSIMHMTGIISANYAI